MKIMKGVKAAASWLNQPMGGMTTSQDGLGIGLPRELNPKRGEPIDPTVYPLCPVKRDKPLKRLPKALKVVKYRKGRVN